jgi:hypothetical protein
MVQMDAHGAGDERTDLRGEGETQDPPPLSTYPPKRPAGQRLQAPAPSSEYFPTPHTRVVGVTDPAGHAYPAWHRPVQAFSISKLRLPNRPLGQASQTRPLREKDPGPHTMETGEVDPCGHTCPVAHTEQTPACGELQDPAGHRIGVAVPMGQYEPAGHGPSHRLEVRPDATPKRPVGQAVPLLTAPCVLLYRPGGTCAQKALPAMLNWPGGQARAAPLVEPGNTHTHTHMHKHKHKHKRIKHTSTQRGGKVTADNMHWRVHALRASECAGNEMRISGVQHRPRTHTDLGSDTRNPARKGSTRPRRLMTRSARGHKGVRWC